MMSSKVAPIEEQEIEWTPELGWYSIKIPRQHRSHIDLNDNDLYLSGTTKEEAYAELLSYIAGDYHK